MSLSRNLVPRVSLLPAPLVAIAIAMAVQKQSSPPSFSSIISVLSIAFFIRVELELNQHKKRLNDLESFAQTKPPSKDSDIKIINNAPGKFAFKTIMS